MLVTKLALLMDWYNSLLYGEPENLLMKVQSVQNAAARLLTNTRRQDHITPVLCQLHWLPVQRLGWLEWSLTPHSTQYRPRSFRRRSSQPIT